MSGVYIKGMDFPKSCVFCELYEGDLYWCSAVGKEIDGDRYEERSSFCPLIPVPDHGRLIDADAFLEDLLFPTKEFERGMRELVADAPTIIPADKEAQP